MKRFLLICAVIITIYACKKETADTVYDTHLFAQLNAHNWVFDSAGITDSALNHFSVYASDTAKQITSFSVQFYTIHTVKDTMILDSITNILQDTVAVLDTTSYQIIYDNPNKIYYYSTGGQLIPNQYLTIDTVNASSLVLSKFDTLNNVSVIHYHSE